MLAQFTDGHQFEQDMSEDALPAFRNQLPPNGREDALEGVKEPLLSGVDGVNQIRRNSFRSDRISINGPPIDCKR